MKSHHSYLKIKTDNTIHLSTQKTNTKLTLYGQNTWQQGANRTTDIKYSKQTRQNTLSSGPWVLWRFTKTEQRTRSVDMTCCSTQIHKRKNQECGRENVAVERHVEERTRSMDGTCRTENTERKHAADYRYVEQMSKCYTHQRKKPHKYNNQPQTHKVLKLRTKLH